MRLVYDISAGRQPYGKPGGQPRPNSAQGDPVSRRADPPSQDRRSLADPVSSQLLATQLNGNQLGHRQLHKRTTTSQGIRLC